MNEDFENLDEPSGDEEETLYVSDFLKRAKEQQSDKAAPTDSIDFASFRDDAKETWRESVGVGDLPQQVQELVSKSILLPRQDFQIKLATAYLMLPSALCNRVPILFSQGQSGCGKSTLGYIACALHGVPPISAGSTFASIRNTIQVARCWNPKSPVELPGNEKHACLVWEDIKPEDMLAGEGNIFSLLKNGVERSGTITIAQLGGENLVFKVFAPKLISSIHPIYAHHAFRELVRRLIIIQHKPRSQWVGEDFCDGTKDADASDLIDLQDLDWTGLASEFREYWTNRERLSLWSSTQRSLARIKKHGIPDALYKMSRDLICCGVVCGLWATKEDAITHLREYWEWHKHNIESQSSATVKALDRFIREKTETQAKQNEQLVGTSLDWMIKPLEIDAKALKSWCEYLAANGELDTNPTVREIGAAMASLGWELKPNNQEKIAGN